MVEPYLRRSPLAHKGLAARVAEPGDAGVVLGESPHRPARRCERQGLYGRGGCAGDKAQPSMRFPSGSKNMGSVTLALMVRSTSGRKTVSPSRLRPFFTRASAMERPTLGLK